jgi:hypothetical protein
MRETRRSLTTESDSYSTSLRLPLPQALDWGNASINTHRSRRRTQLHCSPLNSNNQGWAPSGPGPHLSEGGAADTPSEGRGWPPHPGPTCQWPAQKEKEGGNGWAGEGGELGRWAGLRGRGKRKAGGLAGFGLRREKKKEGRWAGSAYREKGRGERSLGFSFF